MRRTVRVVANVPARRCGDLHADCGGETACRGVGTCAPGQCGGKRPAAACHCAPVSSGFRGATGNVCCRARDGRMPKWPGPSVAAARGLAAESRQALRVRRWGRFPPAAGDPCKTRCARLPGICPASVRFVPVDSDSTLSVWQARPRSPESGLDEAGFSSSAAP